MKHRKAYENSIECKICGKGYATMKILKYHEKTHSSIDKCQCDICGKNFSFSGELKRHEIIHLREMSFECSICFKKYKTRQSLERHVKVIHAKNLYDAKN